MTTPARELYLYWRTSKPDAGAAVAAVRAWQRSLQEEHPGLQTRLLRRADDGAAEAAAEHTLMETYTLAGGIGPALQQQIVEAGDAMSAPWRRGPRHVEVFTEPA